MHRGKFLEYRPKKAEHFCRKDLPITFNQPENTHKILFPRPYCVFYIW